MQVDFVKGHCGFDALTLLPEGQIPPAQELDAALKILAQPVDGGLEVGFLGRSDRPDEIRLRMVDSTARTWIPMCGGMSQVIGKALIETFLGAHFGVDPTRGYQEFRLRTPSGVVPIRIEVKDRRAVQITSVMDEFAAFLYTLGVEPLTLLGCQVLKVGEYCVIDIADLERACTGYDFTRRDAGMHLEIVNGILRTFGERYSSDGGVVGMLYDARPEGPGQFRLYPRFYSADLAASRQAYEFQCGTGTVAVGVALAARRLLPPERGDGHLVFEWGNQRATPDPYGIRTSQFHYTTQGGRLVCASFSHSVVEILAEGRLTLPKYPQRAAT
jgi:hypothetical protein